jgi:PAS domain-containing protein
VEASAAMMRNDKDTPIGFRGIIRDITERKKAEEALENSRRRLEEIIDFLPDPDLPPVLVPLVKLDPRAYWPYLI